MKKTSKFAERVRHDIFFRAQCNEILKTYKKSQLPKELYAYLKLLYKYNASILCIALTSTGKYIDETLLNKEHIFRAVRFTETMRDFCAKTRCKKLFIAINTEISDTVFPLEVYEQTIERVTLNLAVDHVTVESKIFYPDKPFG